MSIRKTIFAVAAPFAVAAAIGSTAVLAQSGEDSPSPTPGNDTPTTPSTPAPDGGRHHGGDMKDGCPHGNGGSSDSGSDTGSSTTTSVQNQY